MTDETQKADKLQDPKDTTPKVTGIGGIFFSSDKPEKKPNNGMPKIWDSKLIRGGARLLNSEMPTDPMK